MNAVLQRVPDWAPPARAQGARVQLQHLGKTFGERRVLDALNLTLEPGEFVAIVGRSGCGKSTLLRLLAGLDTPSQGHVLVDGAPLQADAAAGQGVRLMFQESRLLPWQRVADNVALGLPRTPDTTAQVLDALQAVGLADRAHEWPARLSGGQRQRVALARALVHQPRLLLLDEPLGALDALTRVEMHALLSRLWRAHGCTAVLVTHDVAEAVTLADRVLLIEAGAIALDVAVPVGHPRERGSAALAALEERVLQRVLHRPPRVERATPGRVAGV